MNAVDLPRWRYEVFSHEMVRYQTSLRYGVIYLLQLPNSRFFFVLIWTCRFRLDEAGACGEYGVAEDRRPM